MNVLTADVQNAQRTYDVAMQRADSLKLEGRNDQSVVGVLDRAVAPIAAARPRVLLIIAFACVLGGIFLSAQHSPPSNSIVGFGHARTYLIGRTWRY